MQTDTMRQYAKFKHLAIRSSLVVFAFILMLGFLITGWIFGYYVGLMEDIPLPSKSDYIQVMQGIEENSEIYYGNSKKISDIRTDLNRKNCTLDEVSPLIIKGLIATEDEHFYEHPGIVPAALLRAALSHVISSQPESGGSTITQQLIKQSMLTNEVSFARKAREIALAWRLEKFFSKKQILEAYLNITPFGMNNKKQHIAGIKLASLGCFGKDPKEVNLNQAAFLAGLPQNPYNYNPYDINGSLKNNEDLQPGIRRMKYVLKRMYLERVISKDQYEKALHYDITKDFKDQEETREVSTDQPYLYNAVYNEAVNTLAKLLKDDITEKQPHVAKHIEMSRFYEDAEKLLKNQGLKIYTSVDPILYKTINQLAREESQRLGSVRRSADGKIKETVQNGAVLLENSSGRVLAFVSGYNYDINQNDHAFNIRRSPGSTFKPLFAYGPALEEGLINPSSLLADNFISIPDKNGTNYEPSNFGNRISYQLLSARTALAQSLNNPTIHLYQKLLDNKVKLSLYAQNLGLSKAIKEYEYQNVSLPLGGTSYGPTVAELAAAYATIANKGQYRHPHLIDRIETSDGKVIFQHDTGQTGQAFSETTAYQLLDMLRDVHRFGLFKIANKNMPTDLDYFIKTGTSEDARDSWLAGSTPSITLVSWIGYDNQTGSQSLSTDYDNVNYGEVGSRHANLWLSLLNGLYKKNPDITGAKKAFPIPPNLKQIYVSNVTGLQTGTFNGPFQSNYQISPQAGSHLEWVQERQNIEARFDFAIGADIDEIAFYLEPYRTHKDPNINRKIAELLENYSHRIEALTGKRPRK